MSKSNSKSKSKSKSKSNGSRIDIDQFNEIDSKIAEYRVQTNKLHPNDHVAGVVRRNKISPTDIQALEKSHQQGLGSVSAKDKHLYYYQLLLSSQLSNPAAWGMFPIVDSLNLTLHATDEELERLIQLFENKESCKNSAFEVKPLPPPDPKKNNSDNPFAAPSRYRYKRFVYLKGEWQHRIYLRYGLVGDNEYNNHRPVRISFNPSLFDGSALKRLFKAIHKAGIFDNFWERLCDANVTEVDLAVDLIGVPTPAVIMDSARVSCYESYPKDDASDSLENEGDAPERIVFVQTQYIGKRQNSHFVIYSKMEKKKAQNQKHVCSIHAPDGKELYITRIERVIKVQANGKVRKLIDLVDLPYMFSEAKFYNTSAFNEISGSKANALKRGFFIEFIEVLKKKHGLDNRDNTNKSIQRLIDQPGLVALTKEEARLELQKRMLADMRKTMERYQITVNHDWMKKRQTIILKNLLDMLIPKKHQKHPA